MSDINIMYQIFEILLEFPGITNRNAAAHTYQCRGFGKMRKVRPDHYRDSICGGLQNIVYAGISKTTTNVSNVGFAVNFGQNPDRVNNENVKIREIFILLFRK